MSRENLPTIEYLRQCFRYENGKLFWCKRPLEHFPTWREWLRWNGKHSGREAGTRHTTANRPDRWRLALDKRNIYRSKIVWAMHKGEWASQLDHENRDPLDDRIENLRPATNSQNSANSSKCGPSGYKGVSFDSRAKKWRAAIKPNGTNRFLGYFADPAEAHAAYVAAAKEAFGEFACSG